MSTEQANIEAAVNYKPIVQFCIFDVFL